MRVSSLYVLFSRRAPLGQPSIAPPMSLVVDAGHGSLSRAQKLLLPAHKLLGAIDRPQEGRGRLLVGQVLDGTTVLQVYQTLIDGFDSHAEGWIAQHQDFDPLGSQ